MCVGSTAAPAARLAGYGEAGAKNQGYRLLQEDSVRERLETLRETLREERDARERDWMDRLAAIGRQALAEGALHPAIRAIEAEARIMRSASAPKYRTREARRSARRPRRRRWPIGCAAARLISGAAWRPWRRTTNDDGGFQRAVE